MNDEGRFEKKMAIDKCLGGGHSPVPGQEGRGGGGGDWEREDPGLHHPGAGDSVQVSVVMNSII